MTCRPYRQWYASRLLQSVADEKLTPASASELPSDGQLGFSHTGYLILAFTRACALSRTSLRKRRKRQGARRRGAKSPTGSSLPRPTSRPGRSWHPSHPPPLGNCDVSLIQRKQLPHFRSGVPRSGKQNVTTSSFGRPARDTLGPWLALKLSSPGKA